MLRSGKMPRAAFCLAAGLSPKAPGLTFGSDFVTSASTDLFGARTTTANFSGYGFTGLNTAQIQQGMLDAVIEDFLGYPAIGVSALSPLRNGMGLNIDFVLSTNTVAPLNGDPEYFFVAIGAGPAANGSLVGSILVDNILALAALASSNAQRINLLAGTISHEIGHALSLIHSTSAVANSGASAFDIMGTGAAPGNMPNGERVLNRAFGYSQFNQLIGAVGTRAADELPEPMTMWLSGMGILFVAGLRLRR